MEGKNTSQAPTSDPSSSTANGHARKESQISPKASRLSLATDNLQGDGFNSSSLNPLTFATIPSSSKIIDSLGPLSPSAQDRVFPIKSVVSVEPTPTPMSRAGESLDEFPGMVPPLDSSANSKRQEGRRRRASSAVGSASKPTDLPTVQDTPSKPQRDRTSGSVKEETNSSPNFSDFKARKVSGVSAIPEGDGVRMGAPLPSTTQQFRFGTSISPSISETRSSSPPPGMMSAIDRSANGSMKSVSDGGNGGIVTARFKHVISDGGHAVITGRDGDTLQRCEDEPIHIPGAVQGFGLLIALQEPAEGKLLVRVVSENSKRIIGYSPKTLFALESFTDILSEEQTDNLIDHLDFIRDENTDPQNNGPEVFTISIRHPVSRKNQKLWCAIHINPSRPDTIICEFEIEDDVEFPLVPGGESTPEPPQDTLSSNPTAEEYAESTVNSSRPLRVLRRARTRRGEAAVMEVFNIMSQVQEQLAAASTIEGFLKVLVGVIKELTGFHRVMVYQFDNSWNGRVVTELVDPKATKDLYKGLNFPASDIPKQARDLYKVNKVRLLYDRDQETARLVCRTMEDLEQPLDLTYAYLRAMSPIHLKYLANMAVRASMSISINAFDELWGLIACHAYGSKGMRVSFPIRKMCRLVGDSASRNIERLSYASRLQARKLINTMPTEHNPSGYIIASSDDLLKLFDADYGLLSIRDETKIMGKLEQTSEALAMLEYLKMRRITSVMTSQDLTMDFPDLRYPPGFSVIAGLLLVPLSVEGTDFIVFFRHGQSRVVKWAGNPYEKYVKEGTEGYLEPRKSFKTWSETVAGKSREWTEEQIETAAVLCLVYGKFIEVWRQKEAALQNSQLTKLLLANSAHEVRTPLNAIINYLEIAMEGTIDQDTRDNLSKSHSASKSLIYVINDLLDLTKTEEGKDLIKDDVFDLKDTVREATDMFKGDAKRKNLQYEVLEHVGVPQYVIGDQRRVRQAISNIVANAIQHTREGAVKVELWLASESEDHVEIDIVVQDTGIGMSANKLDSLFRDLEQVSSEGDESVSNAMLDSKSVKSSKSDRKILGLGLAVVARIVRNMNGQLRLKSEEGRGSRFVVQLGFNLPQRTDAEKRKYNEASLHSSLTGTVASNQPVQTLAEGEVMLVHNGHRTSSGRNISRKNSLESVKSLDSLRAGSIKSFRSGSSQRSDVDRLIDAIQEPHMVGSIHSGDNRGSRREGKGNRDSDSRPALHRTRSGASSSLNLELKASPATTSGQLGVTDSQTPVRPVRVPDEIDYVSADTAGNSAGSSKPLQRVSFGLPRRTEPVKRTPGADANAMKVLVAEDDPINSKIIKKRLEKAGHTVHLTINGEECATAYGDNRRAYDIVLMDMQMPIVDGLTSTKMIRSFEKTHRAESTGNGKGSRVPIFAVSASLVEKDHSKYVAAGFDGWILKPIDFKRLSVLLSGTTDPDVRRECLYTPGLWERGGWFAEAQVGVDEAGTKPDQEAKVHGKAPVESLPRAEQGLGVIGTEQERLRSEQERLKEKREQERHDLDREDERTVEFQGRLRGHD